MALGVIGKKPIVLVGMTGAGKSTVGRILAGALERGFQDSDDLMSAAESKPLRQIMLDHGEPYFREVEEKVNLNVLANHENLVLATGGGAVIVASLREAFKAHSFCVWLKAKPEMLMQRLSARPSLPVLLLSPNPKEKLLDLLNQRRDFYSAASHVQIETENFTPQQTADHILTLLPEI